MPACGRPIAEPPRRHYLVRVKMDRVKIAALLALLLLPGSALAARKKPAPPPAAAAVVANPMSAAESGLVSAVQAHSPPPAEYLFLLDTAGEMLPFAQSARADIASIVEKLPEGDRVEIVVFHTRPTVALPSTAVDAQSRSTLAEKIRTLQLVSANDSDLGGGLAYAVSRLDRVDGTPLQFLFMASTFCHSPSISSDYDSGGRGCRSIRGLDKMASTFTEGRKDRRLVATLFEVATGSTPVNADGLASAQKVLGSTTVVDTSTTSFSKWAADYAARLPLERALPLVQADVAKAALSVKVLRQPTAQKPSAQLEISSGMSFLSMHLTNVVVQGSSGGVLPTELDLTPTATLEVPLKPPTTPIAILPGEDTVEYPITLTAVGSIQPPEGITAVGLTPDLPAVTAATKASWHRTYGLPGWLVAILVAGMTATGAGIVLVARRRLRKVRLGGTFTWRRSGGPRQTLEIGELEEAYVCVNADGDLVLGKRAEAVLALRMRKQGLDSVAEAELYTDGVEINRKAARRGRVRVVPGATSFQFGEYRLSWE